MASLPQLHHDDRGWLPDGREWGEERTQTDRDTWTDVWASHMAQPYPKSTDVQEERRQTTPLCWDRHHLVSSGNQYLLSVLDLETHHSLPSSSRIKSLYLTPIYPYKKERKGRGEKPGAPSCGQHIRKRLSGPHLLYFLDCMTFFFFNIFIGV